MAHRRIRPFGTQGRRPERRPANRPARAAAVRGGRILRRPGRCPQPPDAAQEIPGRDPRAQGRRVMRNRRRRLGQADGCIARPVAGAGSRAALRRHEAVCRATGACRRGGHPVTTGPLVRAPARRGRPAGTDPAAVIPDRGP